nr:receptor expression-enhancing protein 4 isoform X1 [Bubalus bubalis]
MWHVVGASQLSSHSRDSPPWPQPLHSVLLVTFRYSSTWLKYFCLPPGTAGSDGPEPDGTSKGGISLVFSQLRSLLPTHLVLSLHHAPMGHFCRPEQAWGVCKQQGREVASRALTQAQVVQAKREEQGRLVFGMLYPAYASYKAVKTKNIREYVRWMMYWIVFALFMAVETFTDIFISWFPFYYEIKMAFVLWLLSPYTRGASMLYRKFVHPSLSRHEKEIDTYIVQAKERSYETVLSFGKRGLNIAASAAVQAATKSQGALAGRLRSFSMQDLRTIPDGPAPTYQDPLYLEDQVPCRRPPIGYRAGGLRDSDTDNECWSDTEVVPQPPARPREKPLGRSQSLRVIKRKPLAREGTSRSLKVRTRKKTAPSDMDS